MDWTAIGALATATMVAGTFLGAAGHRLYARGAHDTSAYSRAKSAETLAAAALAKIEIHSAAFNAHSLDDARAFARLEAQGDGTARAQAAAEMRISKSLDDLGKTLERTAGDLAEQIRDLAQRVFDTRRETP